MRLLRPALLIVLVLSLAAINFPVGIGEDPDAFLVVQRAHQLPTQGFAPSRTWGFPLYEVVAYPLIVYAGEPVAKAWSAVCVALASVAFLAVLERLTADRWRAFAGAVGFVVLPVTIVASTTMLETAQGLLLAILALLAWQRWRAHAEPAYWYAFALTLGCAIGTRPDYVLLAGAFAFATWRGRMRGDASAAGEDGGASAARALGVRVPDEAYGAHQAQAPRVVHLAAGVAIVAACALLPYLALYGRFPFTLDVIPADPFGRRLVRALFGVAALIGLPALVFLAASAGWWMIARRRATSAADASRSASTPASRSASTATSAATSASTSTSALASASASARDARDLRWLAVSAAALYVVRFVSLPDELDYIVVLAPLLIAVVVASSLSRAAVVTLTVLLALPNVVQLHLFERTPAGTIRLAPGISSGAIAQERSARARTRYLHEDLPALMDRVAARFGVPDYTTDPLPGGDRSAIIPEDALRFYRADRRGGALRASAARARLIVYPLPTGRGWRQFLQPDSWRPVTLDDFREVSVRDLPP